MTAPLTVPQSDRSTPPAETLALASSEAGALLFKSSRGGVANNHADIWHSSTKALAGSGDRSEIGPSVGDKGVNTSEVRANSWAPGSRPEEKLTPRGAFNPPSLEMLRSLHT